MINTGSATPRLDLLGPILQEGMPEEAYVAAKVLPTLIVQKRFGAIPSFLFTDAQTLSIKHAPKTGFAQLQSKLGQANYNCTEAGIEEPLSFEDYEILGRDSPRKSSPASWSMWSCVRVTTLWRRRSSRPLARPYSPRPWSPLRPCGRAAKPPPATR